MTETAENAKWDWWTADEVSAASGIPKPTLYAWAKRGQQGPPFYRFGGTIKYRSDEVTAWMAQSRRPGDGSIPAERPRGRDGKFVRMSA